MKKIAMLVCCVMLLPAVAVWWWYYPLEDIALLQEGPLPFVWAYRQHKEQVDPGKSHFHYVSLQAMALDLKLATLAGEDANFFNHGALDIDAMSEALQNFWHGQRLRGASTISQQLAKNLFLSHQRSWWRKINELRFAMWLERQLSKQRILEIYLNIIELGPKIYGVDAASRFYFNTTAAELTFDQATGLAASIPSPLHSNPATNTIPWDRRRVAIVKRMPQMRHLKTLIEKSASTIKMKD